MALLQSRSNPPAKDAPPNGHGSGNRRAAWLLVLLAPVVAELAFGSTPITLAWLVLAWMPIYGAGVLLARELVVRAGRGWPSLVALGLAYELVEDGLGLQALTSTHLYDAPTWGLRVVGFNGGYWEINAVYHVVFSILVPIALVRLAFPTDRDRPYVRTRFGLGGVAVAFVLGVVALRAAVPPSEDPGYQAPVLLLAGVVVVVVALGVVALKVLPRVDEERASSDNAVPGPTMVALLAGSAVLVTLPALFRFGTLADLPEWHQGWTLGPALWVLLVGVCCAVAGARWGRSHRWSRHHTLAALGGALVGHTLVGVVAVGSWVDGIGVALFIPITVGLLVLLARREAPRLTDGEVGAA